MNKKHRDNKISVKSKDVLHLLNKFSVDDIENSLVKLFLDEYNLTTKNTFLYEMIERSREKTNNEIREYLEQKHVELTLKNLERIFELLIEGNDRKLNGVFYTPEFIVDYIIGKTIKKDLKICDPSCGSGAFLVEATKKISKIADKPMIEVIEKNIYGSDILERSIKRTKTILTLLALKNGEDKKDINFNLKIADSLNLDWKKEFPEIFKDGGFGAVIGNPPYVRTKNLPEEMRNKIHQKWHTASGGNIDIFIPFIELGINILNKNGTLGYIVPNGYFTSITSKTLREYMKKNEFIKEIVDFNHLQIFDDAMTYTCITILDKKPKKSFNYVLKHDIENLNNMKFWKIKFSDINSDKWILLNPRDRRNIQKLENAGIPLGEIANINIGIATLNNDLYIIKDATERNGYYIKEFGGIQFKIEKGITKEIIKASIVKTEDDILNNKRRIIFPYKKEEKKARIINEIELKKNYPECYKYFLAIKNELSKRDKGKRAYDIWYAYGRSQGLINGVREKLISPDISHKPRFVICRKREALFYCGYGISLKQQSSLKSGVKIDMETLGKMLNSNLFWYYINKISRNYSSGYKSYAKHFIENFSIPTFTDKEINFIKNNKNSVLEKFLLRKYGIKST